MSVQDPPRFCEHQVPNETAEHSYLSGATQKRPVRATSKPAIFKSH